MTIPKETDPPLPGQSEKEIPMFCKTVQDITGQTQPQDVDSGNIINSLRQSKGLKLCQG